MDSNRRNVQNLDVDKLDDDWAGASGRVRRTVVKRLRELRFKGFGISIRFNQKDERGSEEI